MTQTGPLPLTTDSSIPPKPVPETECPACAAAKRGTGITDPFVYSLGSIAVISPNKAVEMEFIRAAARVGTKTMSEAPGRYSVLHENRYLARQVCWLLIVGGAETYCLKPVDMSDYESLVASVKTPDKPPDNNLALVIGRKGPISPPELCGGLPVAICMFEQFYIFTKKDFLQSIPLPEKTKTKNGQFRHSAEELFDKIVRNAGPGNKDAERALIHIAMQYSTIYSKNAEMVDRGFSLTSIASLDSPLGAAHGVQRVIFTYIERGGSFKESYCVDINCEGIWPYLINTLAPCVASSA